MTDKTQLFFSSGSNTIFADTTDSTHAEDVRAITTSEVDSLKSQGATVDASALPLLGNAATGTAADAAAGEAAPQDSSASLSPAPSAASSADAGNVTGAPAVADASAGTSAGTSAAPAMSDSTQAAGEQGNDLAPLQSGAMLSAGDSTAGDAGNASSADGSASDSHADGTSANAGSTGDAGNVPAASAASTTTTDGVASAQTATSSDSTSSQSTDASAGAPSSDSPLPVQSLPQAGSQPVEPVVKASGDGTVAADVPPVVIPGSGTNPNAITDKDPANLGGESPLLAGTLPTATSTSNAPTVVPGTADVDPGADVDEDGEPVADDESAQSRLDKIETEVRAIRLKLIGEIEQDLRALGELPLHLTERFSHIFSKHRNRS